MSATTLPSSDSSTLDLRAVVRVLVRRKWLLILPWAVALVVGVAAAFLLRPIYFSTVTMMIEGPTPLAGPLGEMVGGGTGAKPDQQAEVMRQQAQSTAFLRNLILATKLTSDPSVRAWALRSSQKIPGLTPDQQIENFLVGYLRTAITIKRDKGDVLQVIVGDYDADRAQRLAQAVADQFVASTKAAQLGVARATKAFSGQQQEIYKRRLDDSEARLAAAMRAARPAYSSALPTDPGKARGLLEQANLEVNEQEDKVSSLRSQFGGRVREGDLQKLATTHVASLQSKIVSLERELSAALLNEGADGGSGARILISRKFGELEQELSDAAAGAGMPPETAELAIRYRMAVVDLAAKRAGRDYLASRAASARSAGAAAVAPEENITVQRLKEEVESNRALYNSFVQQSAAAQITEALESTPVSGRFVILEPATWPFKPGKPNRLMLILLAFVMGGILGVGTVMVVEQHDESVKDADEIESLIGLPVLGAVPRVDDLERSRKRRGSSASTGIPNPQDQGLLHRLKVESPLGLEFRRIFLKLAKTRGRSLPHTLLVTSATRGEGKSTTAACLAITLARELREKLLLVDFDLRSPSLHRALGLPSSSWGVAQMLQQRHFDERFVRATAVPGLDFLSAGRSERPAGELVDMASVEWFLQEATSRYPIVVIDAPPNLAVPDPLILGRAVEGVLYVLKAGSTVRKAAEYGVKVQREARDNVLGVLMNDVGEFLPQYYGYRADTYGYSSEVAGGES